MNEIVGTLYYVLANDHNSQWAKEAEPDTYFLFNTLMVEMRDVFVPDLDTAETGIQGRIANMQNLLSTHDPEVQEHLQECGIDASFYAIRWLTTLLSREFLLPDTIRLWDSMFASTHKENFLRYVCGTMVLMVREDLLKGDFSSCLRLLQQYPSANVDILLESSRSLWIYESQITLACHKGGISLHQALQTIHPPPSIMMAFGLRGGVAPNLTIGSSSTADSSTSTTTPPATDESTLLGRAKRLWSGWNASAAEETAMTPTAAAAAKVFNGWNRGRHHAVTSNASAAAAATTTSVNSSQTNTNGSGGAAKEEQPPAIASPPPSSRIWNRGASGGGNRLVSGGLLGSGSTHKEEAFVAATSATTTTTSTAEAAPGPPPPRSRLWNRGARANTDDTVEEARTLTPVSIPYKPQPPRPRAWNRNGKHPPEERAPDMESPEEIPIDPAQKVEIEQTISKAQHIPAGSRKDIMEILSS